MKKILMHVLASRARSIIAAHRPEIIAITGSVGKTSTKEAIAAVLAKKFDLRSSYKNYNNEIGVPLTVIGEPSAGRSLLGWKKILRKASALSDSKAAYPQALVLEMGIDHPGDMAYLAGIAGPTRAVFTRLGTAHAEFFPSVAALHAEKLSLAKFVSDNGWVIYNYEDENLRTFASTLTISSLSYGFDEKADVRADQVSFSLEGASFKLYFQGSVVPVHIHGLISRPGVLAALAAAAVGFSYGMNAIEISEALKNFALTPGRMNVIAGQRDTVIIDSTYNASPEAVSEGLKAVAEFGDETINSRWAVLGDMRELGKESITAHEDIGRLVAAHSFDYLITVGDGARRIAAGARAAGFAEDRIKEFKSSQEAAEFLDKNTQSHDLVFVKGSQAVRLERIVKALMKHPEQAGELLVRQTPEWQS